MLPRIEKYIEDYDNYVFWCEWTDRLAKRDLIRIYGARADKMSAEERFDKISELEERYIDKVFKYGLERFGILAYEEEKEEGEG